MGILSSEAGGLMGQEEFSKVLLYYPRVKASSVPQLVIHSEPFGGS